MQLSADRWIQSSMLMPRNDSDTEALQSERLRIVLYVKPR